MLTTSQAGHFRTFGFTVLRGYLADRICALAWMAVYQRCPETGPERERTLRSVHDSFEQAFRGFDTGRYPVWRDWLAGAAAHPRRAAVIERMRHAGVLDLPGARDGW